MRILVLGGGLAAQALLDALAELGHAPARSSEQVPGPARFDVIAAVGAGDSLVQICRAVRDAQPSTLLLAVTDQTDAPETDPNALLDAGASDLLAFPCRADFLRARLRAALQRAGVDAVERENAEKFRLLFSNELDAISICDLATGRFLEVNEAWVALYGYTPEEAVGRMGPKDVSAEPDSTQRAILASEQGGAPCKHVRWHRSRAGNVFPVEIYAGSYALGERRVLVSMIRDITERVRLETQLRQADRLASMGTLSAGVAHEINNPLSFVVGNLEFLSTALQRHPAGAPLDPSKLLEAVNEARDGARRVREVVKDLKTFARADETTRDPVEVAEAVDVALRMLGNELQHRAILQRHYAPSPRARVNEARLGQVFVNLLTNAVQALPNRPREQNVLRVCVRPGGPGETIAEITDNGVGISQEIVGRIFDPFFTTKEVGEGTGLGLSICHGIVTGFGGRMEVESQPGRGSTFRVILPAEESTSAVSSPSLSEVVEVTSRPLRLLLIDDERNLGLVLGRALAPAVDLQFVTDGREGLRRISAGESFDAVVCDLMMPTMTGMEFYDELQKVNCELARRTGFITGGTFTPPAREFASRMNGRVIEKPFLADDLQALVQTLSAAGP